MRVRPRTHHSLSPRRDVLADDLSLHLVWRDLAHLIQCVFGLVILLCDHGLQNLLLLTKALPAYELGNLSNLNAVVVLEQYVECHDASDEVYGRGHEVVIGSKQDALTVSAHNEVVGADLGILLVSPGLTLRD